MSTGQSLYRLARLLTIRDPQVLHSRPVTLVLISNKSPMTNNDPRRATYKGIIHFRTNVWNTSVRRELRP